MISGRIACGVCDEMRCWRCSDLSHYLRNAALGMIEGKNWTSGKKCRIKFAGRVVRLAASHEKYRRCLDLDGQGIEIVHSEWMLAHASFNSRFPRNRHHALLGISGCLVACPEKMKTNTRIRLRGRLAKIREAAKQCAKSLEAK